MVRPRSTRAEVHRRDPRAHLAHGTCSQQQASRQSQRGSQQQDSGHAHSRHHAPRPPAQMVQPRSLLTRRCTGCMSIRQRARPLLRPQAAPHATRRRHHARRLDAACYPGEGGPKPLRPGPPPRPVSAASANHAPPDSVQHREPCTEPCGWTSRAPGGVRRCQPRKGRPGTAAQPALAHQDQQLQPCHVEVTHAPPRRPRLPVPH